METKCEEKTLENFKQDILQKKDNQSLLAVHVNVRNAKDKKSYLKDKLNDAFLLDKPCGPNILCLSETHREIDLPDFSCYNRFYGDYEINSYGGVCMYVKKDFKAKKMGKEYHFKSEYFEHLWVKLQLDSNSIVIGVVYRHGSTKQKEEKPQQTEEDMLNEFQEEFFEIIDDLKEKNQRFYILGDFNINFLPKPIYFNYKEKLECLKGCKSLIDKPTRVSNNGKTRKAIDHIYTSDADGKSGVVQTDDIADHYPIYCSIPRNNESKRSKGECEQNEVDALAKDMENVNINVKK